ncbi:MAG: hypothetical protein WD404_09945 [Solirubrobacterales bacterium]
MGGHRTPARGPRWRSLPAGAVAAALSASLIACGGSESSNGGEADAAYDVRIVRAEFPVRQRLGETHLLRLGVRNSGEQRLPALTVSFTVGGERGRDSGLPFGIRDPQPGLAQPDRPVWVLSDTYPRLAGSSESAGAETAAKKTFDFGPLKAGETVIAVWQLSAVRTGRYRLFYELGAGLGGKGKAETAAGVEAGGSFAVRIGEATPEVVVTDDGEVVPAPRPPTEANR